MSILRPTWPQLGPKLAPSWRPKSIKNRSWRPGPFPWSLQDRSKSDFIYFVSIFYLFLIDFVSIFDRFWIIFLIDFCLVFQTTLDPKGSKRHPKNNKDTQPKLIQTIFSQCLFSASLEASDLKGGRRQGRSLKIKIKII